MAAERVPRVPNPHSAKLPEGWEATVVEQRRVYPTRVTYHENNGDTPFWIRFEEGVFDEWIKMGSVIAQRHAPIVIESGIWPITHELVVANLGWPAAAATRGFSVYQNKVDASEAQREEARGSLDKLRRYKRKRHPKYVLVKYPGTRTSNTVWLYGKRADMASFIGQTYANDSIRKFERHPTGALGHLSNINPQATPRVRRVSALCNNLVQLIAEVEETA
jgi:hypothetical protein